MRYLGLFVGLFLSACTMEPPLPPALPDPPHWMGTAIWTDEMPGFATPEQRSRPPVVRLPIEASDPHPGARPVKPVALPPRPARSVSPETVVAEALRSSTVLPTKRFYWEGTSGMLRYPYQVGKVWQVYSSPNRPTLIQIPPGLRLAAPPMLDTEEWEWQAIESGTGATRQESVLIRPMKAGVEAMMPLLTTTGLAFLCQLKALEKTSMVAVTWEIAPTLMLTEADPPTTPSPGVVKSPPRKPRESTEGSPRIALDRLHTAYTISVVSKATPPWTPKETYDDGSKTIIRFAEPLTFTDAPIVFAVNADRSPALVEFTTWSDPAHPEKGLFYLITGLFPALSLRGADGLEVKIVRQP